MKCIFTHNFSKGLGPFRTLDKCASQTKMNTIWTLGCCPCKSNSSCACDVIPGRCSVTPVGNLTTISCIFKPHKRSQRVLCLPINLNHGCHEICLSGRLSGNGTKLSIEFVDKDGKVVAKESLLQVSNIMSQCCEKVCLPDPVHKVYIVLKNKCMGTASAYLESITISQCKD